MGEEDLLDEDDEAEDLTDEDISDEEVSEPAADAEEASVSSVPKEYDQDLHAKQHENITTKDGKQRRLSIDVLKIFLSFSRYLGAFCALHVLNRCHGRMSFRQIIELCFVCSQMNNPYRFYYVMNDLLSTKDYEFDEHPFNDWYRRTREIFGETKILGGRNPRFNSAGSGDIGKLFGNEAENGNQKLEKIVDVLEEYLQWIDNLCGLEKPQDIPADELEWKMREVAEEVTSAGGKNFKDFASFRLSIFLTHAIGACLTRPGKHLRQVVLPHKGTASESHMNCGACDVLPHGEANVQAGIEFGSDVNKKKEEVDKKKEEVYLRAFGCHNFDEFAELLHKELGIKEVFRDFTEVVLCETKPNRSLNKKDWLIRGIPLYDLDNNGYMVCKLPGKLERWTIMERHNPIFKDTQLHLRYKINDVALKFLVQSMANKAREEVIKLNPRKQGCVSHIDGRSSLAQNMLHFYHETALFVYEGSDSEKEQQKSMRVLANNGLQAVQFKSKNIVPFKHLGQGTEALLAFVKVSNSVPNLKGRLAGCFHMQKMGGGKEKGKLSFYDVHKDKTAFDWVTFIPLSSEFFTVTATPKGVIDDMCLSDTLDLKENIRESSSEFQKFQLGLSQSQKDGVVTYMKWLEDEARKDYKCDVELQAWFCAPGASLTFPAKIWWHGTITKNGDTLRDLLILHPMVE